MGMLEVVLLVCCVNDTATTEIYTYLHTLSLHDALPIFFQIGQRRLDHAGARCVETVAVLGQRLDDLVAMTRLLGQQGEDQELQEIGRASCRERVCQYV